MHRIDGSGATVSNMFTEGDPISGVEATTVTDDWLNDVQENICRVITAAGLPLTKGRADDLLDAIAKTALTSLGAGGTSATDFVKIPYKDKATGVRREIIIQFGAVPAIAANSSVTLSYATAFPNSLFALIPGPGASGAGVPGINGFSVTLSQARFWNSSTSQATQVGSYIAIGF